MERSETLRAFAALPLTTNLHQELDRFERKLQRTVTSQGIRWVPAANVHLTLFFFGDISSTRLGDIKAALTAVTRNIPPFTYAVQELGVFPNLNNPRVIWAGINEHKGYLNLLHKAVNEALANVGFTPEDRPFSPHLTLGRVRRQASRAQKRQISEEIAQFQEKAKLDLGETQATQIILFRSVLQPTGAVYTPLSEFPLKG